jgi:group I intron endonuclease
MYIYKITNLVNQKVYVGQTVQKNPKMRWYDHQASARKGKKSPLYNSIRKHGVDNFAWEIIDSTLSVDDLNKKEAVWLDHYRNLTEVYNIREAGNNKLHSDKSILKMQESQRQAHARRRAEGRDGGWKRIDGGPMKGKSHPGKGKIWPAEKCLNVRAAAAKRKNYREGKVCVTIDGKKNWIEK